MGNWQEIIALCIVASTTFLLAFRVIRQWLGTAKGIGGCSGCSECGSQREASKVSTSAIRNPSTMPELLQLEVNPKRSARFTK
ncbi:hypothetical protein IH992_25100 [Candidatus Poribacteria bacterium]|nr:hypothetical protein [Candidatus Poribacteria bacterium]